MKPTVPAHPARERRRLEQRRLLDVARRYARRLADVVPVEFAVVGGSVARGDFHDASDIDVLVVSDALPQHPLQRSAMLFSLVEGGVEPKGLTRTELTLELARRNPFVLEAMRRGVVVYPEGLSLQELRRQVERGRRGLPERP